MNTTWKQVKKDNGARNNQSCRRFSLQEDRKYKTGNNEVSCSVNKTPPRASNSANDIAATSLHSSDVQSIKSNNGAKRDSFGE